MIRFAPFARRRRLSLVLGTSTLAWGLFLPAAAQAQCAPDPTQANGTTTCTGTDPDGVRVTTAGTTLAVAAGALVTNSGAPAIAVDVPVSTFSYLTSTVNVLGTVSTAGQNSITVSSGALSADSYYSNQLLALTIGADASVSGSTALALLQSPGNNYGTVSATVDNAGTLTGTSGIALLGNAVSTSNGYSAPLASFSAVINQASARIVGGILGPLATLTNAGSIDGGALSAVNTSYGTVTNSVGGTIRSASSDPTITGGSTYYLSITNAGLIENAGNGGALSGGTVSVTNQTGGQIRGGITAATTLNLLNQGTITGNVVAGNGSNTIDSTTGTINGSVTLGSGSDTLMARYAGSRTLATGITGTVDGGGGNDVERVLFASDTSVTTPVDLAAGFQRLVLAPNAGVTATLENGFSTAAALVLSGTGTVVNRAAINVAGPAVTDLDYAFGSSATFRNEGAITATVTSDSYQGGVTLSSDRFVNAGQLTVFGGVGALVSYNDVNNSGTITASGTGVSLFDGVLTNSGTIVSTGGAGINLYGNVGYTALNSGTIQGATAGAITGIYLTNTGTISSPAIGVEVEPYGYLINAAGGTVNGGSNGAVTVSSFNAGIANAGTINGDVTFNGAFGDSNLTYIALTGGMLNGNLKLGAGATLIADLVNTGPGQFAGIAGTVTADSNSNSALRYAVNADASTTLPEGNVGPFSSAGYQLNNGAALTITAPGTQTRTQTLVLAGNGSVDVNANIAVVGVAAIQSTSSVTYPGQSSATDGLSITSRGALAVTRTDNNSYTYSPVAAVVLRSDSFTNTGTITVTDHLGYNTAGIYGGTSVTNNGQILLDGGVGISGSTNIVNTGTIGQVAGGLSGQGVVASGIINNAGTINVGGNAVQLGSFYGSIPASLTNAGTLASTGGVAVASVGTNYGPLTITNLAGGTITAAAGTAVQAAGVTMSNAGTITGDVDLGYTTPYYSGGSSRSGATSSYTADGGTIAGNLLFGDGDDAFVATNDVIGVSGTIDGGAGTDLFVHALTSSGTTALGALNAINFEREAVRALGSGTVATITAAAPVASDLYLSGNGSIVNKAAINGSVVTATAYNDPTAGTTMLASFDNQAAIRSFAGSTQRFANGGAIGLDTLEATAVAISQAGALDFSNSGQITNAPDAQYGGFYYPYYSYYSQPLPAVSLYTQDAQTILNTGQITGGLDAIASTAGLAQPIMVVPTIAMTNTGTITGGTLVDATALNLAAWSETGSALAAVTLTNSGTIQTSAVSGIGVALTASNDATDAGQTAVTLANSGTISANGGGTYTAATTDPYWARSSFTSYSAGVAIRGTFGTKMAVSNAAGGVIKATAAKSVALISFDGNLMLANAGTIGGGSGTSLDADDALATLIGSPYLAGAIQTVGGDASISNTGTITGSIALGGGNDTIENRGTITGNVFMGAGDDSFLQQASAILSSSVDGGDGDDTLTIDATGGGTVDGDQFVNFERFSQTGMGNVSYLGNFRFDTIGISGGAVTVATGRTLSSNGATTLTGNDAAETVLNNGTIAGSVALGGGDDQLINNGTILGVVSLGAGDDQFMEGVGNSVTGKVDGGGGNDLYTVMLAGNRTGIGQRTGFERLGVQGSGTLTMALDQDFQSVALGGATLDLSLAGHTIGAATGSDASDTLAVDGDIASVSLGGGDDTLALGTARAAGNYDGGTGNDTLRFTAAGSVTLTGTATNFGAVSLASNALTVTGTLGSAEAALAFGAGNQSLTVAKGGMLAGTIDLGDGDDSFRLAAGATLIGTVNGGAGADTATMELVGTTTLTNALVGFETLGTEGAGQLSIAAPIAVATVAANADITVAETGSLMATQVRFGAGDNRFTIAGRFVGSVDGDAGNDMLAVSSGSEASPILFSTISNVETYNQSGGFAHVSGTAAFSALELTGGRLIGQAGSTIAAPQILVRQGATFGSAGAVNGNLVIAGTLSPGASPGTMTVNGDVTLASGSTSLFELSPTVSDKLVVNGAVSIGSGSTLQLVKAGTLRPGTSYTLITATNGITGGYTTILKPVDLFGFIVQRANEIDLLGEFVDPGNSGAQVSRSIAYTNRSLEAQASTSRLFDALPALLTSAGASNPQAFARLTPEPYASATQMSVDNALVLVDTARGPAFATTGEAPHAYTFGSALGQWHRLGEDVGAGTSAARTRGYGFLGGIGYGDATWSVGAFGGYLNNRQNIDALAARTKADGAVAGVQGRLRSAGGFGLNASVIYDGSRATTSRVLPVGTARGDYGLHSWIGDVKASYEVGVPGDWALTPQLGVTYLRVTRSGVAEAGNSPFALTVARNRHAAGFADGAVAFGRAAASVAPFRPFVSLGVRYQIKGRRTDALAGYAGGGLDLEALGARRTRLVGTASGGISYRLKSGLDIFATASSQTGSDDNQESVSSGLRLQF